MTDIVRIVLLLGMLALPLWASAQVETPPKKQEVKVGSLDVIYDEEEYKGVAVEPEEEEDDNLMYQVPFFREAERSRHSPLSSNLDIVPLITVL